MSENKELDLDELDLSSSDSQSSPITQVAPSKPSGLSKKKWTAIIAGSLAGLLTAGAIAIGVSQCSTNQRVLVYTITFNTMDGSTIEPQKVNQNEKIVEPKSPVKDGFRFNGWYDNEKCEGEPFNFKETKVSSNLTLYACWIPDSEGYKITLGMSEHCKVSIEGSKTSAKPNDKLVITASDIESGYSLVCSSINETSYIFFDENNKAEFTMPACDVVINTYCTNTPTPPTPTTYYTILFNAGEGAELIGSGYSVVEEGEYFGWINKPTAIKEGETFVCWTDETGNKISDIHEIKENMSVYASFVKSTNKVYSYLPVVGYFTINDPYTTNDNIEITVETEQNTEQTVSIPKDQFDCPIYFGSEITEIKDGFLQGCTAFNQPIVIGPNITKIGKSFLNGCSSFNSSIEINNSVVEIVSSENNNEGFMFGCSSFNQQLILPNNLKSIPNGFLQGCSSFNQPLILPEAITTIGKWFLNDCLLFNQNLLLPASITTIDDDFMFNCDSMISTINIQFDPNGHFNVTDKTLSSENEFAESYTTGIIITGASLYGEYFRQSMCPDRSESPFRKLNSTSTTCFLTFSASEHGQIIGSQILTVEEGTIWSQVTKPSYKADVGYKFNGWTDSDGNPIEDSTVINDDLFIIANFVDDMVTVNYKASGPGTIKAPTTISIHRNTLFKDIDKPEIIPNDKCILDGYYINGTKLNDDTIVSSDSNIEIKFIDKPITVTLQEAATPSKTKTISHSCNHDFRTILTVGLFPFFNIKVTSGSKTLTSGTDYVTERLGQSGVLFLYSVTIFSKSFDQDILITGNFIIQ